MKEKINDKIKSMVKRLGNSGGNLEHQLVFGEFQYFLNSLSDGWISVEDELPAIGERVLVAYQAKSWSNWMFEVARFGEGYCWNWETVHWKPLPAPPEDTNG